MRPEPTPLALTQHSSFLESDCETPVGMFMRLAGENQGVFFESAAVDGRWGRFSIIAYNFLLTLSCREGRLDIRLGDEGLAPLREHADKPFVEGLRGILRTLDITPACDPEGNPCPAISRALYGYLGYGIAGMLEDRLASCLPPEKAEAALALPGTIILFDHVYNRINRLTLRLGSSDLTPLPAECHARPVATFPEARAHALTGREAFIAGVARTREKIRQGEAIQVVLSTPFSAPLAESPFTLYRRLRLINPSPYMFYMRFPHGALLGSSPEVMVTCTENRLRLCPIAGTRPRSRDVAEDALFSDDLLQDPKEKAEHVMLVDLGRNDLGRIARPGTVSVDRYMDVERFSHVMHLTSRIHADLQEGLDALDVLRATFPAGTVSGAPKVRAMEMVAEEEQAPRGPYAGAVGWIGLDRDSVNLDFGIVIRSMWVRDGQVRWQAGAGIVFDSVPEKEWEECCNKAAVINRVIFGDEAV